MEKIVMNELQITGVRALQILDSRGYPTVKVWLTAADGTVSAASAPSGASTGAHEAVELRDGGPEYAGRGVQKAVANVRGEISELLTSRSWTNLADLDHALVSLDGTPGRSRLGANAIVAVSMAAARAFAARLLTGSDDATSRTADLALRGQHPDVREVRRTGAAIDRKQAEEIVKAASLSPTEGDRKVMILHEFHLLSPDAAGRLLKTIEEPPASTTFIVLADLVPHDLVTISSRCVRIGFRTIPAEMISDRLVLEGVDPATAAEVAEASAGDLDRARLLANDPELVTRRRAFRSVATRLDGSGAVVIEVVDELLALIERAAEPLLARQATEATALQAQIDQFGERGSGKKQLEDRHKRELRRHRTDELRLGLTALASAYRDRLVAGTVDRPDAVAEAVHRLHRTMEMFDRNANETLQLQALLWSLPPLPPERQ